MFTPAFWHGHNIPIGFYFSFTSCITTPWIFDFSGFSDMSDLYSISRDPLLRILLMVQYLRHFWRVFQNGLVNLAVISTQYGLPDIPIFLAVSALVSGLLFFRPLLSGGSYGICILFPCVQGYPTFLEGPIRVGKKCPGKYYTCLFVCLLVTENVSTVSLP